MFVIHHASCLTFICFKSLAFSLYDRPFQIFGWLLIFFSCLHDMVMGCVWIWFDGLFYVFNLRHLYKGKYPLILVDEIIAHIRLIFIAV